MSHESLLIYERNSDESQAHDGLDLYPGPHVYAFRASHIRQMATIELCTLNITLKFHIVLVWRTQLADP